MTQSLMAPGNKLHDMEKMMALFMHLDQDKSESVSRSELESFYQRNNLDRKQIDDWMRRFDANSDGSISLDEYCHGLGLNKAEVMQEQKERVVQSQRETTETLKFDNIQILATSMSWTKQEDVIREFTRSLGNREASDEIMNQAAIDLQNFLNQRYGRIWQCVILTGSYWMKFTHEPFMSIQFKYMDKYVVLAWRTHKA